MFSAVFGHISEDMKLSGAPSYEILRDWKGSNGRRFDVAERTISDNTTLYTKIGQRHLKDCLVIKSQNLKVSAYTKGKVIYSTDDSGIKLCGTRITVIPLSDIKSGGELALHLEPKGKKAKVILPIYTGAKNDILLSLFLREKTVLYLLFTVLITAILTVQKLLKSKIKTAPLLCLLGAETCIFSFVLCGSDIAQLFIGSSLARLLIRYFSLAISLPLLLLFFTLSTIQKLLQIAYYR